jgi:hypothetical protein
MVADSTFLSDRIYRISRECKRDPDNPVNPVCFTEKNGTHSL